MRNADPRVCLFCGDPLTEKQTKFCSRQCIGFAARGKGKSYIRIRIDGERVYLHRYIFEQNVRPLEPGECVHHIDGNKHNNDPDNLEALTFAEHLAVHDYHRANHYRAIAASTTSESPFRNEYGW